MNDVLKNNLIKKIGKEAFNRIESAHIGLAGAGGLGSNCAANLVRVGFRSFVIADFDKIDHTNLDRQFYFEDQVGRDKLEALKSNLLRINPDIEIDAVRKKLERGDIESVFGGCDAVAECFDAAEYKSMIVSELSRMKKFTVSVSGLGGIGSSDSIKVHRIRKDLLMIGDLASDILHSPALAPRVSVAAAKQADAILEYVIKTPF
jgi:sulfur carrier protein ThiS adenylyltransferase